MASLREILPDPKDLLALEPEELAGILLELLPGMDRNGSGTTFIDIEIRLFPQIFVAAPDQGYPNDARDDVGMALAEALSWLETQGLIVRNPGQAGAHYVVTRRGAKAMGRSNFDAYRLGRTLPVELLQDDLAEKVHHLYLRGDYEVAVFQAFKMVEVAVRRAGGFAPDDVGMKLMRAAFRPEAGPLTDKSAPPGEQEALMELFAGAMGYAKNPPGHRDVAHNRQSAARLIIFASELLEIALIREFI
ncbi:TIGR02391 family protein [Phenylobacterium sp.]|uniref:TIGR02391 family protein n=1 Tax=Phenylobacterium sp. TaxID=1871053 RepID=UPI00356210E7